MSTRRTRKWTPAVLSAEVGGEGVAVQTTEVESGVFEIAAHLDDDLESGYLNAQVALRTNDPLAPVITVDVLGVVGREH